MYNTMIVYMHVLFLFHKLKQDLINQKYFKLTLVFFQVIFAIDVYNCILLEEIFLCKILHDTNILIDLSIIILSKKISVLKYTLINSIFAFIFLGYGSIFNY